MDQDRAQDWRELCTAVANELDPNRLTALVAELTMGARRARPEAELASENDEDGEPSFSREYCGVSI